MTNGDLQDDGAVFPNGQPTPAGQDLNYRLYGPRDASFAKLAAISRLLQRDPLMLIILADGILLVTVAAVTTANLLVAGFRYCRRPKRSTRSRACY